jgi:hypothetical protein
MPQSHSAPYPTPEQWRTLVAHEAQHLRCESFPPPPAPPGADAWEAWSAAFVGALEASPAAGAAVGREFLAAQEDLVILEALAGVRGALTVMQVVQEAFALRQEAARAGREPARVTVGEGAVKARLRLLERAGLVARPVGGRGRPTRRKGVGITAAGRALLEGPAAKNP